MAVLLPNLNGIKINTQMSKAKDIKEDIIEYFN